MQSSSCSGKWSLPVMLIVDLSLARVVQHSPFYLAYNRVVSQIDGAGRAYAHAHDDHYLTRSKFNSLLTEMITPQNIHIRIYIYILARVYTLDTSGDENHLCGASLRKSHKISLKAHRHACAHWVGTPIARPEKLPRQ